MKDKEESSSPKTTRLCKKPTPNDLVKPSVKCRVDQILAVTDENGYSFSSSESCYSSSSSGSGCSESYVAEEGEESILEESISAELEDASLSYHDDRILVKLPGRPDPCAPTESNFTDDVPFGAPHDNIQALESFREKSPVWSRTLLVVSLLILILGGIALFVVLRDVGLKRLF